MAVFQPAEELGTGAQAMIDDGLFDRVGLPGVVLGQHVAPLLGLAPDALSPGRVTYDLRRLRLRDGEIDETLAELVVAEPLDAPAQQVGHDGRAQLAAFDRESVLRPLVYPDALALVAGHRRRGERRRTRAASGSATRPIPK